MPLRYAAKWNDPMTVEVVAVWDVIEYHVNASPQVTHTMEVTVQEGPAKYVGKTLFLPYDSWAVGKKPPTKGSVVTMMPSQWVSPDPTSRGAPHPGWDR